MSDAEAMQEFEFALSRSLNDGMKTYSAEHGLPVMFWNCRADLDESGMSQLHISGHPLGDDLSDAEGRAAVMAWAEHLGLGFEEERDDGVLAYKGLTSILDRNGVVRVWGVVDAKKRKPAPQQ